MGALVILFWPAFLLEYIINSIVEPIENIISKIGFDFDRLFGK